MKKQSGFTLIELMVVMAIIAILATAGLSAYTGYIKKARDTARIQIARQLMIKVEQVSTEAGPPTPSDLEAFLAAENFTWVLPTMNPVIARVSGAMDSVFGTAFALPDIDPLKGKAACLRDGGSIGAVCGFAYVTFTDGTYVIGYAVESTTNRNNFWSLNGVLDGAAYYGNFIGSNPVIISTNTSVDNPASVDQASVSERSMMSETSNAISSS